MPIYMDRHIIPGITLKDATEAHKLDVAIQDNFGCKAITFWLDEERNSAFCLIDAPNESAVRELHNSAHGLVPHEIIEVDESLVMAFLGRINDPKPIRQGSDKSEVVFYDPAYRAIMITFLPEASLIPARFGNREGQKLFNFYKEIIEETLELFKGREVRQSGDGYIASFTSVGNAVNCAAEIQNQFISLSNPIQNKMNVAIGISGGEPITGKKDLFGEAIQSARRLCYLSAGRGEIMISAEITELFGANRLRMLAKSARIESLTASEEQFLTRFMDVIEEVWNRPDFTLGKICRKIGVSRSNLYRSITSLTGRSFTEFFNEFRLMKSLDLIEKEKYNITRVALETGFNNPSYFTKCFKERFGLLPSEFARTIQ